MSSPKINIEPFEKDAAARGGYVYTLTDRLSCRLATGRSLEAILGTGQLAGRSILDVGCGDGHYTIRYWDRAQPRALTGVDAAVAAIRVAREKCEQRPIRFEVADVHALPFPNNSFDLALIQSILHHDEDPADIIREAFRVAPVILIHEPNGNNLGLKVLQKASRYHREHREKSYTSRQLVRWVEQAGGEIQSRCYAGFVPMFCPDWLARGMKAVEPLLESVPGLRALGCAVFILTAKRK
jgi:ubiquinone/menaquinone biosynthesis C-methylase UbiE